MFNAPPTPAQEVGYFVQTFGPYLNVGVNWFAHNFYVPAVQGQYIQNGDETVYLPNAGNGYGICTAEKVTPAGVDTAIWKGAAFGGGFYVEAILSFPLALPTAAAPWKTWPAFWMNPIEGMSTNNAPVDAEQWTGQANQYLHSCEIDVFEVSQTVLNQYGVALHDWCGPKGGGLQVHTQTPPIAISPESFVFPNRFGFRNIPATKTTQGEARWYFNGVPVGQVINWNLYDPNAAPPPVAGTSAYSIMDARHYSPIITANNACPVKVHAMSVWQENADGNLYQ